MKKETFLKYLKDKCSDKEFEELCQWINWNAIDEEGKKWAHEQWNLLDPEFSEKDKEKYSALLHKIHHEINLKGNETGKNKANGFSDVIKWFSRVAAILLIPLLSVIFYLLLNTNSPFNMKAGLTVDTVEVIAPIGSQTVVQLSDGTEVSLNYGSKIIYPQSFIGDTREIKLTGEGYFDVAHNPEKPFIVKTDNLKIKVIGTEFNVQAYANAPIISTTLVNGKVIIEEATTDNKTFPISTMKPGQHVKYNKKTGKITSTMGTIDKYIAWKTGKMVFDNAPISEVAMELSRKFNVNIILDNDIKDLTYTVTFIDDPLDLILNLMTEITPVRYEKFPRQKLSDGSFSKQEIKLLKKN